MADELTKRNAYVPASPERRPVVTAYPIGNEYPIPPADNGLQALESVKETSTPIQRAVGLSIRTLPLAILWLVLSFILMFLAGSDWPIPFIVFVILTSASYAYLNGQEHAHSAAGVERLKAELSHDLQSQQIQADSERKDKMINAYVKKMLED